MSRATLVRAVVTVAVLALSLFLVFTQSPRLGLDLRGGTQLVLETKDSPTVEANREATDRTLGVLRQRVDALGVAEPNITRSGDQRIIVELPGLQDPREAAKVLGRTAQLSFHPVLGVTQKPNPDKPEKDKGKGKVLPDESGQGVRLGKAALTGADVDEAEAQIDPQRGSGWFVTIDMQDSGKKGWTNLTAEAACADLVRRLIRVIHNGNVLTPRPSEHTHSTVPFRGESRRPR